MSWLNTIKGQLTTLAQEVLAEGGNILSDEEQQLDATVNPKTAIELLAQTQSEKEELDRYCSVKDSEIAILRQQIAELQNQKISDSGGGGGTNTPTRARTAAAGARATGSGASLSLTAAATVPTDEATAGAGRTTKSLSDSNAGALEDSWCWELDTPKQDNDHSSDTSSGNGNEMVNITLEEVPLGASAKTGKRVHRMGSEALQKRVKQLEEENKQLNCSLEELDSQHNLAMQNVLELKSDLQQKLNEVTKSYEALKREQAEKFISGELELGKLRKQLDQLEVDHQLAEAKKQFMQKDIDEYMVELKKATDEMADLHALLEKKNQDNVELIERIKETGRLADKTEKERGELLQKVELLMKEVDELKAGKEKKTSESSTSSIGKHSEDEFIVVREGDANSSGPTTPPTKEELKDKIVQLENRVSELTLENGSLSLKLQDREMEKELSANVLKENLQTLQNKCDEQADRLRQAEEQLAEQQEKIGELKEKAADAIIAQEQVKVLSDEKLKIDAELTKMRDSLASVCDLEKRLLFSEHEKESLQLELQGLRVAKERVSELEGQMQKLTLQNQQFKLNEEAETETLNNSAELDDKIKILTEENESLRVELDSIAQAKFSQVIAEEKQEITDLDADEEESFNMGKLRDLLDVFVKQNLGEHSADDMEKAYKNLHDRLWKIDRLEKSFAQMSEEIIDLQDNKLVWDHEKKTLEADISQYILQCDELMKNNEILLNELENYKRNKLETISENNEENIVQLESQLEECSKLNRTLEEEYAELNEKVEDLERENQELTEKLRDAQQNNTSIKAKERDYSLQLETLELEKCNLLFELNELKSTSENNSDVNSALQDAEEKCQSLQNQLVSLSKDHAELVAAMLAQKASLMEANRKREEKEKALKEQEAMCAGFRRELEELKSQQISGAKQGEELDAQLKQELLAKDIVIESLKSELQSLAVQCKEVETKKESSEQLLLEQEETLAKLRQELQEKGENETNLDAKVAELLAAQEAADRTEADFEKLKTEFEDLEMRFSKQSSELNALQDVTSTQMPSNASATDIIGRIAQLEADLLATADLQKTVDTLNYEKNEMIKALQQKHAENMQYYMEIQRLQPIVQQLQQQQAAAATLESKCPTLESTIAELRKEQEKFQDQINFLKEKSDILTTNLLTEQTNQRLVRQEKADVEEQNAVIRKDLERLREHLLEVEDLHTQETVDMQRELEATKATMISLQEQCSKSSNAYTSASIRANQHAETLQAQYALLVQQRDELVAKLSLAEDRESKNQAALCNLQCALEQFQNDKENDIKAATQRIRKELQQELNKEAHLQHEIASLQQQLADANQGLRAASRLSDQLEACQQTIAVLREEVETLKQQNRSLEERLSTSESSQTDKIDKSLIKSLLIGYVVSEHPNDKSQVLRMISSVLEFTQGESDKVGLNKQHSSWLGSILGSGTGTGTGSGAGSPQGQHSKDNLVQAFVQFLEQESQPKGNAMPTLLNMTPTNTAEGSAGGAGATTPASRRTSVASNSGAHASTPIPIQPLILNSNVLNEFTPSRNSSSILKDILNDS